MEPERELGELIQVGMKDLLPRVSGEAKNFPGHTQTAHGGGTWVTYLGQDLSFGRSLSTFPPASLALISHVTITCCPLSSLPSSTPPLPFLPALLSADYQERFNPSVLKDSALSTHKPIEVKGLGGKATIIHAQYNTPISMYSQDAIMDAIAGQAQAQGSDFSG